MDGVKCKALDNPYTVANAHGLACVLHFHRICISQLSDMVTWVCVVNPPS